MNLHNRDLSAGVVLGTSMLIWVAFLLTLPTTTADQTPPEGMVLVPAGEFWMGVNEGDYPDSFPLHKRYVEAFYMDVYEVTNEQYKRFCDATGHRPPPHWKNGKYPEGYDRHPVCNVSWYDAVAFCKWAGKRLPTEAEWEKAARGTDGRVFPWGNQFTDKDQPPKHCNAHRQGTTPVGSYPTGVSPYGCHDMIGNIAEWTADWYEPYPGAPKGTIYEHFYGKKLKVVRGGSWDNFPTCTRATFRGTNYPWARCLLIGFRCAKSVR